MNEKASLSLAVTAGKADEPDAIVHFLDADGLTGQTSAQIDFLAIETQPPSVLTGEQWLDDWL